MWVKMEKYSQLMFSENMTKKTYGVKGGTPLRDRRRRRLPPYRGYIALLIPPAILTPRI